MYSVLRLYGEVAELTQYEKRNKRKVQSVSSRKKSLYLSPRRHDSLIRTRRLCLQYVLATTGEFGSPILCTLTFKGSARNIHYADTAISKFFRRLRVQYPYSAAIAVPEVSPRGRIHLHALLFNVPFHSTITNQGNTQTNQGTHKSRDCIGCPYQSLWSDYGFADYTKTDGSPRLANYISKYITKCGGESLLIGTRLIKKTKNIVKTYRTSDDVAQMFAERYSSIKPDFEWSRDSQFLGKFIRRYYKIKQ